MGPSLHLPTSMKIQMTILRKAISQMTSTCRIYRKMRLIQVQNLLITPQVYNPQTSKQLKRQASKKAWKTKRSTGRQRKHSVRVYGARFLAIIEVLEELVVLKKYLIPSVAKASKKLRQKEHRNVYKLKKKNFMEAIKILK